MKKMMIAGIFILSFSATIAQEEKNIPQVNLGFGLGIDYGGLGGRLTVLPVKNAFLFAGAGYNFNGPGYNAGAGFRILPNDNFCPYVIAMYGYNAVIVIFGEDGYNKTFYGPTAGVGFEARGRRNVKNYFNFELLVPFRSKEVKAYQAWIEEEFDTEFISSPVAVSLGYHIGL